MVVMTWKHSCSGHEFVQLNPSSSAAVHEKVYQLPDMTLGFPISSHLNTLRQFSYT